MSALREMRENLLFRLVYYTYVNSHLDNSFYSLYHLSMFLVFDMFFKEKEILLSLAVHQEQYLLLLN